MSLSCALLATSLHQWARRYIRLTQPARRTPEKRARMRAFYANGVDKMHVPWAVEGLPTLLHLSLFLFFAGVAIFLFNVDDEVFACVVCWIGLFLIVYGLITLLPFIRHESPYYTPPSKPAWYLYFSIPYVTFTVLAFIADGFCMYRIWHLCDYLKDRYRERISYGMEKMAEETAEEQTSEIDLRILDWTIIDSVLGDDDSLEKFFEAIPGLFYSKRLKDLEKYFPRDLLGTFWEALDGFMEHSKSVTESIKSRRADLCKDIVGIIPNPYRSISDRLSEFYDRAPVSIERLQIMQRWRYNHDTAWYARNTAARNLTRMQERDGHWVALARDVYRLPKNIIERHVKLGGDSAILAIVIDKCRRFLRSNDYEEEVGFIEGSINYDICHTLPTLQHDFCTLWNELVQAATNQGTWSIPVEILREIRLLYISLHQGTDAAPTAFSASTRFDLYLLVEPSSYPLCDIPSHRPDFQLHPSPSVGSTALRQIEQASTAGPSSQSDPTTPSKIGDISQAPATTEPALPVHTSSYLTDPSPPGSALPDIPSAAALPHTLQGSTQQDIVATGTASAANPMPLPFVASFSIPAPPPSSHVPPSATTESFALPSSTKRSLPTSNGTLPRLRACGLVNSKGICFANAVLQLLVHSPPFWNLVRDLGDLKRQRGARGPEIGGSATPLADATMRFFDEFIFRDGSPLQPPERPAGGKLREAEEAKKEHNVKDSFEPTYLYDEMKRKKKLGNLLVRFCDRDSPFYH